MKKLIATSFVILLASLGTAVAGITIASYSSGVLPQAGFTGAADPTSQGWTAVIGGAPNNYCWGGDSTIGGWRITDGTSTGNFVYQRNLSAGDTYAMTYNDWTATWTSALVADAVSKAGGGADNYYSSTPTRQNNNAMWVEVAGQFAYIMIHKADASGNLVLSDGTSNFQITTTGNQMAQEMGTGAPYNVNYVTYTLSSVGGVVSLTDSLGGNHGPVATYAGYTPSLNRVVWGAFSNAGQGSTAWNEIAVTAVPEPTGIALSIGCVLALAGTMYRRRKS